MRIIPRKTVDCRAARRMTKKLESPIPWWSAQSHYTCNSVFAGLQQLAYRIGNSALHPVCGHRSNGGVVGCAARSAKPKMKLVEGRLGLGFDSLAFQKNIDSQKSDAVPESAVDGALTMACELPGRREHFIKGKTIRRSCGT